MVKNKAFTLIELLIVVAIIGILAMIAIPNFRNALFRAQYASVITDLKAIGTALQMALIDVENGSHPANYRFYRDTGEIRVSETQNPDSTAFASEIFQYYVWITAKQHELLTTPIPYLNQLPEGVWSVWNRGIWNGRGYNYYSSYGSVQLSYQWRTYGSFTGSYILQPENLSSALSTKGWFTASKGPSNQSMISRDSRTWFNPTNGIQSEGCVWYDFSGVASWLYAGNIHNDEYVPPSNDNGTINNSRF